MEEGQVWQIDTASTLRSHVMMAMSLCLFSEIEPSHLIPSSLCDRSIDEIRHCADIRFVKMTIDGKLLSSVYDTRRRRAYVELAEVSVLSTT